MQGSSIRRRTPRKAMALLFAATLFGSQASIAQVNPSGQTPPVTFDVRIPVTTEFSTGGTPQVTTNGSSPNSNNSWYNVYQACKSCIWAAMPTNAFANYVLPAASQFATSFSTSGVAAWISSGISSSLQASYGYDKADADAAGNFLAQGYVGVTYYSLQKFFDTLAVQAGGNFIKIKPTPGLDPKTETMKLFADMMGTDAIAVMVSGGSHAIAASYSTSPSVNALASAVGGATYALVTQIAYRQLMGTSATFTQLAKEQRLDVSKSRRDQLLKGLQEAYDVTKPEVRTEMFQRFIAGTVGANLTGNVPYVLAEMEGGFEADGVKSMATQIGWYGARRIMQYLAVRGTCGTCTTTSLPSAQNQIVIELESNSRMRNDGETSNTDSPDALMEFLVRDAAIDAIAQDLGTSSPVTDISDSDFLTIKQEIQNRIGTLSSDQQTNFVNSVSTEVANDLIQGSASLGYNANDQLTLSTAYANLAWYLVGVINAVESSNTYAEFRTNLQSAATSLATGLSSTTADQAEALVEQEDVTQGTPDTIVNGQALDTTNTNQMAEVQTEVTLGTWDSLSSEAVAEGLSKPVQQTMSQIQQNASTSISNVATKSDPTTIPDQNGIIVVQELPMNGAAGATGAETISRQGMYRYAQFIAGVTADLAGQQVTPYQQALLRVSTSLHRLAGAPLNPASIVGQPGQPTQINPAAIASGAVASAVIALGGPAALTHAAINVSAVADPAGALASSLAAQAESSVVAPTAEAVSELINSLIVYNGEIVASVVPAEAAAAACLAQQRQKHGTETWMAKFMAALNPISTAQAQACAAPPAAAAGAAAAIVGGNLLDSIAAGVGSLPVVNSLQAGRYGYFERGSAQPFTINGANFPSGVTVSYNAQACTITSSSSSSITGTCPAVTTPGAYTFTATGIGLPDFSTPIYTRAPIIASVSPSSVMSGAAATFTLDGNWFTQSTSVNLDGNACSISSWTPETLVANCPGVSTQASSIPLQVYEAPSLLTEATNISVTPLPATIISSNIDTEGGLGSNTPLRVGYSYNADASITSPSGCNAALSFASTDSTVLSVDSSGNITAVGPGTAGITVSTPGVAGVCAVASKGPISLTVTLGNVGALYSGGNQGVINGSQASVTIWGTGFSTSPSVQYAVNIGGVACQDVSVTDNYQGTMNDVIQAACDVSSLVSTYPVAVSYGVTASYNGGTPVALSTTLPNPTVQINPGP